MVAEGILLLPVLHNFAVLKRSLSELVETPVMGKQQTFMLIFNTVDVVMWLAHDFLRSQLYFSM
jgi:hypothetical protein